MLDVYEVLNTILTGRWRTAECVVMSCFNRIILDTVPYIDLPKSINSYSS